MADREVVRDGVAIYDAEDYDALRFFRDQGIRYVSRTGYNTDLCVRWSTAGYKNLRKQVNVFLAGDATLATSAANLTAAYATDAAVSVASVDLAITQVSWIWGWDDARGTGTD